MKEKNHSNKYTMLIEPRKSAVNKENQEKEKKKQKKMKKGVDEMRKYAYNTFSLAREWPTPSKQIS